MTIRTSTRGLRLSVAALLVAPLSVYAQSDAARIAELERRTAELAQALAAVQDQLRTAQAPVGIEETLVAVQRSVTRAQATAEDAGEWRDSRSVTHLAGYAAAGYASQDGGESSFNLANFNPIFHFQYGDSLLWESELEIEAAEDGSTNVGLEYSTLDWFLNDSLTLVMGKFISPIGFFRQNLHPAWINPLASAPPGFGHDGAAPAAEVGVQLRGAFLTGSGARLGFASYVGNGPKLVAENGELHGIETEGFTDDPDDEKVVGGRISFLPIPDLELAISGGAGDAAVVDNEGDDLEGDPSRGYSVIGADFSWRREGLELRGEYVRQKVDDEASSVAPEGATWESGYVQGALRVPETNWQGVLRYTDFRSGEADESQEQWMVGMNYILTPNALIKFGFEFNDGQAGEIADDDRWLVQFAYGY